MEGLWYSARRSTGVCWIDDRLIPIYLGGASDLGLIQDIRGVSSEGGHAYDLLVSQTDRPVEKNVR
jgi:hypothetical protein